MLCRNLESQNCLASKQCFVETSRLKFLALSNSQNYLVPRCHGFRLLAELGCKNHGRDHQRSEAADLGCRNPQRSQEHRTMTALKSQLRTTNRPAIPHHVG